MRCKNKRILVDGFVIVENRMYKKIVEATITNDEIGKTLTLSNGATAITIPFEKIEKYLK